MGVGTIDAWLRDALRTDGATWLSRSKAPATVATAALLGVGLVSTLEGVNHGRSRRG